MNYAIIFAGGVGSRMGSSVPKQFLEINNTPIIVHTLSIFNLNNNIDGIVVVSAKNYIETVAKLVSNYKLDKVFKIAGGGDSALESQFIGIDVIVKTKCLDGDIVLIHDGVRPFVDDELINQCIDEVKKKGTAITVSPAAETVAITENGVIKETTPREKCLIARAPQCFYLKDIYNAHLLAQKQGKTYVDSASMLLDQGKTLNPVFGPDKNIKITTPYDYELAKLLLGDKK